MPAIVKLFSACYYDVVAPLSISLSLSVCLSLLLLYGHVSQEKNIITAVLGARVVAAVSSSFGLIGFTILEIVRFLYFGILA